MIFYMNVFLFRSFHWLLHGEQGSMNIFFSIGRAGGASSTFSLAPTKTLNDAGDITTDHRDVPAISLKLTWWSCWNIGHEGWFFLFSSCLLYNHAEWNIFFHDFGTWCLSSGTSVCRACVPGTVFWTIATSSYPTLIIHTPITLRCMDPIHLYNAQLSISTMTRQEVLQTKHRLGFQCLKLWSQYMFRSIKLRLIDEANMHRPFL